MHSLERTAALTGPAHSWVPACAISALLVVVVGLTSCESVPRWMWTAAARSPSSAAPVAPLLMRSPTAARVLLPSAPAAGGPPADAEPGRSAPRASQEAALPLRGHALLAALAAALAGLAAVLVRGPSRAPRVVPLEWIALTTSGATTPLSDEEYDRQRLALDAEDMAAMEEKSAAEMSAEAKQPGSVAGAWKWEARKKIWDMMEAENIARFPRPVHHRIPNFVNADLAAKRLANMEEFLRAKVVKVNPDTPQKMVRYFVLEGGKTLLTPQPRLRTGFFSTVHKDDIPRESGSVLAACNSAGVVKYGKPISLDEKIKVDMIVVGSSCVTPAGARLGKGEGFAELEYGILRWMGAVDDDTLVVTTVHDSQVLEDDKIPPKKLLEHDVPVDIIVTPTRVIYTKTKIPKPPGILWHKLSPQKLAQIRVLQQLKERLEREAGAPLPTGPDEVLPPLAERNGPKQGKGGGPKGGGKGKGKGGGRGRAASRGR